jgi:Uma2 family endonuclease
MATTTSTPLMSWEAFERLPGGDGFHRELIEGELQVLPPAKSGHSKVAKRCYKQLASIEQQTEGQAFIEAGYKIGTSPASWIQPDASFIAGERVRDTAGTDYFVGAPELAVEVVSASESASDLQRKIGLLLKNGGRAVWIVYPRTQTVEVHLADGTSYKRTVDDQLDAPFLLAGWHFPVAKLFEE